MDPCHHPSTGLHKAGAVTPAQQHNPICNSLQTQGVNEAHGGREELLMPPLQGTDAPALTPASPSGPSFGHLSMENKDLRLPKHLKPKSLHSVFICTTTMCQSPAPASSCLCFSGVTEEAQWLPCVFPSEHAA